MPLKRWMLATEYSLEGLMLKLKPQYSGHLMQTSDSFEKTLMLGKIEGRRRQRMTEETEDDRGQQRQRTTEDEMAEWHHRLNGHKFE